MSGRAVIERFRGGAAAMRAMHEPTAGEDQRKAAEMSLAKQIWRVLWNHYPGHMWRVTVDTWGGIACVSIPLLMGDYQYLIKLADLHGDPTMRAVVRAGGEILERYQVPRGLVEFASLLDAVRTRGGLIIPRKPPE